jgi:hypothetical protein
MRARGRARLRSCSAIAMVLAGCVAHDAVAQSTTRPAMDLVPGSRVRITLPATKPFVGTLLGATSDSMRVQLASGSSVTLPTASLAAIELSTGVRRHPYRGALIGFASGAVVGAAIGFATYRRTDCIDDAVAQVFCGFIDGTSREVTVVGDAGLAGVVGGAIGLVIGQSGRESWVRVPTLGERTRIGVVGRGVVVRVVL